MITVTDFDLSDDLLIVESETPDDVIILGQTDATRGVLVNLSTGGAIWLEGLRAPINPGLTVAQMPGTSTLT